MLLSYPYTTHIGTEGYPLSTTPERGSYSLHVVVASAISMPMSPRNWSQESSFCVHLFYGAASQPRGLAASRSKITQAKQPNDRNRHIANNICPLGVVDGPRQKLNKRLVFRGFRGCQAARPIERGSGQDPTLWASWSSTLPGSERRPASRVRTFPK